MSVPSRTQQDVEILSGRRGPEGERAVRLKELRALDQRANALAGALQREIADAGIPSIREKIEAIRAFIYNTLTYVDNEVDLARNDLQALIDAQGVTIIDIQGDVAGNAAGITLEAAARAAEDTALAGQITTISTEVTANSSALTIEQLARTDADVALAADITTLEANFAAANASLTQQGQVLTTLEGYAAATYVLRAAAGGASAGLEIVAADDPVSGAASALRFYADDILLDGSVTALHIDVESLAADTIFTHFLTVAGSAFMNDLEVNTLQIKGNAVTIPVAQTITTNTSGSGSYKEIQWLNHTLDFAGEILVIWNGAASYATGDTSTAYQIRIDGSPVVTRGGLFANDYPTIMYSGSFPAGTRRIAIWFSANSTVTVSSRTLSILGVKR
ncbi:MULTISPECIES: hypothetical protein [Marivita]|uniref:DUF1983 domain-containing protein n=1 Tax=Marivita cryptomonadis TaxID=505252 RepID=A0A9Q2P1F3_9RHOB|nr:MULTISPECIES: hypothetical protein [Marivita]MCR9170057.1 hypothetical protein [Paracoccaceae bacterium]MBM2322658.1 hypothetical protein [Marivita cryptomonadis]MBM2332240.1 hypothetical protein [Marivita cryptomonadis]MBM2341824.1 hypothetical protein [Marivita cryptomonadis]MBM2346488.1 hypothetical protein [Marivita cryptomonadis]